MGKDMLGILLDEGWELDELTLARFRRKHNILLRANHGFNFDLVTGHPGTIRQPIRQTKRKRKDGGEDLDQPGVASPSIEPATAPTPALDKTATPIADGPPDPVANVSPQEAARRVQRLLDIQMQSDQQLQSRKRRRRIRGYGHLPADDPSMPPRYKSETSLDECKAFLQLNNDTYKDVRQRFADLCLDMGIVKKTLCEPGLWQTGKDRLVREHNHLAAVLNPLQPDLEKRDNALEVICSDVTKRLRVMKTRLCLKDANNILGLNPADSKELRRQFYQVLKDDRFQTMLLCGKQHWGELKQQWWDGSELAQRLLTQGMEDEKKRSVDVLLRDAMKRHNDDHVAKFPHMKQHTDGSYGPGPGPARRLTDGVPLAGSPRKSMTGQTAAPAPAPAQAMPNASQKVAQLADLDPALFAAFSPGMTTNVPADPQAAPNDPHPQNIGLQSTPTPAYFRLSPKSSLVGHHPRMWLAKLAAPTTAALNHAATAKTGAARVDKIHGIVKNEDGSEDSYQIDGDDELEAYLETAKEVADGKATFVVVLEGGYA